MDYKTGLTNSRTILDNDTFLYFNFGEMTDQVLNLYSKTSPKFKQVAKQVPIPRTFELLAFDG